MRKFTKTRMADAHCHLYGLDLGVIKSAKMVGVEVMITNGINTKSNIDTLNMIDRRNVYGMVGIHPEFALKINDEEIEFNKSLIESNLSKITGIGEIGLDYTLIKNEKEKERQKEIFIKMLDIAVRFKKPVSIHSREALPDVFSILKDYNDLGVHIHFFEGSKEEAKYAEKKGYYISVPYIKSTKRVAAIKVISIKNILAETDSPTASATPSDVSHSIEFIANSKGLEFEYVAETTFKNTQKFFNIDFKSFMR